MLNLSDIVTEKRSLPTKKSLKGKNISVTESLTTVCMAKLNEAREIYGFMNVWASDGRILVKEEGLDKPKIFYG